MEKGKLIVISGFAGAGKGTLVRLLLDRYEQYALSVSVTTRKPRPGEENGVQYFFRTREEFEAMIEAGELLEHAAYVGNYYGTPRRYVEERLAEGRHVILEIEVQGALAVKESFPEALLLFITPPGATELKRRLTDRGTETPEQIAARMARAAEEAALMERYDYVVVNDELELCVQELHALAEGQSAQLSQAEQTRLIQQMQAELMTMASQGKI